MSALPRDKLQRSRACLLEIADALGVAGDAFFAPREPLLLNVDADGARWLLLADAHDDLLVRHIASPTAGLTVTDETVAAFLVRDPASRQHQVLAELIDSLLLQHLAG